jgi:signal transduction histidine kinase
MADVAQRSPRPGGVTNQAPLRSFLASFNPRWSLAAATGWSIAAVTLAAALLSGIWTGLAARAAIEREIGLFFAAHAQRLVDTIDANLAGRRQWIAATARVMGAASLTWVPETRRAVLDDLRKDVPEIEWAGIADVLGRIVAASGGRLEGYSVEARPWFTSAFNGPFVDAVHPDLLVTGPVSGPATGEPRRLVDMAAPLTDRQGEIAGIFGISLGWSWIEALRANAVTALHGRREIEVLLVSRDGIVLSGSSRVPTGSSYDLSALPVLESYDVQSGYLTGVARSRGFGDFAGLGWYAIVREPTAAAFAPAYRASLTMVGIVTGWGLLASLFGAWIASRIMRRLKGLARAADDLRLGRTEALPMPSGNDESARIGRSLATLVGALQSSNEDLARLNEELDQRVNERSRQIERMSEEARSAALVRERLRIARDLHDTLAHSLLALITQIRLIRKLSANRAPGVDRELAVAETAAKEGLDQARGALTQLRYSPVKDDGLGAALERLAKRLTDRVALTISLDIDPQVRPLADSRTEIAYRVVEEAVRNVEKHAEAARLSIAARLRDIDGERCLELVVSDDGRGFDPLVPAADRFGLVGAQEQADLVGGSLSFVSNPGAGTTVVLVMPM